MRFAFFASNNKQERLEFLSQFNIAGRVGILGLIYQDAWIRAKPTPNWREKNVRFLYSIGGPLEEKVQPPFHLPAIPFSFPLTMVRTARVVQPGVPAFSLDYS